MIQCRYCGRPCGCHASDPCVCWDLCYDCDVEPEDYDDELDYWSYVLRVWGGVP